MNSVEIANIEAYTLAVRTIACIASRVSESVLYKEHWSNEFCMHHIEDTFESIKKQFTKEICENILKLPNIQKLDLGFKYWDEANDKMLIPLWFIMIIPETFDVEVTSIFGDNTSIKNIDNDTRAGCVAYYI